MKDAVTDLEIRARVISVDATMNKFDFLFGLVLAESLLRHTDNLSKTLQAPYLTASEGQQVADLTCRTLGRVRNTEAFNLFWEKVQVLQREYGVDEASLPRRRKAPRRFDVGFGEGFYPTTGKELYSQHYFQCVDFIVSAIKDRFDQPGYKTLQQLENLLIKAAKEEVYKDELAFVLDRYMVMTSHHLALLLSWRSSLLLLPHPLRSQLFQLSRCTWYPFHQPYMSQYQRYVLCSS